MPDTGNELVKIITSDTLKEMMQEGVSFQLIDVREPAEHEAHHIGGELIPLNEVLANRESISTDKPVIFYCRVGVRSHIAIQRLQEKFGYQNLYNLKGGITEFLG